MVADVQDAGLSGLGLLRNMALHDELHAGQLVEQRQVPERQPGAAGDAENRQQQTQRYPRQHLERIQWRGALHQAAVVEDHLLWQVLLPDGVHSGWRDNVAFLHTSPCIIHFLWIY